MKKKNLKDIKKKQKLKHFVIESKENYVKKKKKIHNEIKIKVQENKEKLYEDLEVKNAINWKELLEKQSLVRQIKNMEKKIFETTWTQVWNSDDINCEMTI